MTFRVVADLGLCQGHRMCQGEAPGVLDYDAETDQVVVIEERPDETRRPEVAAAVQYCPAMALSIEEEQA